MFFICWDYVMDRYLFSVLTNNNPVHQKPSLYHADSICGKKCPDLEKCALRKLRKWKVVDNNRQYNVFLCLPPLYHLFDLHLKLF